MNIAVLLSGGSGNRVNTDIPKQYVLTNGHMMVLYALKPILDSDLVDLTYIVAGQAWREAILADAKAMKLNTDKVMCFAEPGTTRQTSILNAMKSILSDMKDILMPDGGDGEDTVLIHDAARPMLTEALIESCYKALPTHDGVMPALPMKDTVYLSEHGGSISGLLDRGKVYAGQAPELFRLKPYYDANKRLMPDRILDINGASEPAIMAGMDIVMIPGDEGNFKVTTDADMERFRRIMEDAL